MAQQFVRLRPDLTGFRTETQRGLQSSLGGLALGGTATRALALGGIAGGVTLLASALVEVVTAGASFEQEMNKLQAVTGATDADMDRLSDTAKQLGSDVSLPAVSAQDAAQALGELAKAGLNVEDSISGARGVLQLATAAEIDTAAAAELAANALNAFGLGGDQAVHVADLLAGASISAQGSIADMGLALQQSAALANQVGLSLEDLTGLITELARAGIRGSDAGTSLRTFLLRLVPTSKEARDELDRLGVSIDEQRSIAEQLPEILDQYRASLANLTPVQQQAALATIFGTDAIRAASIAIRGGAAGFREAVAAADQQGAAAELAAARTRGLAGQFQALQSGAETLAIELGELTVGPLADFVGGLSAIVSVANEALAALKKFGDDDIGAPFVETGIGLRDIAKATSLLNPVTAPFVALRSAAEDLGDEADSTATDFANMVAESNQVRVSLLAMGDSAQVAAEKLATIRVRENLAEQIGITPTELARLTATVSERGQEAGEALGRSLIDGVAAGITDEERAAIDAARDTLDAVIRAGDERITEAIRDARTNLESLGDQLSSELAQVIDLGPLDAKLQELRRKLDDLQDDVTKRQLRFDLSKAERDLEEAKKSVSDFGDLTPQQRAQIDEFLDPFIENVEDAKAKVKEFDLEEAIDRQEKLKEKAKAAAEEGIAKLVDQFEKGKLSSGQFATILQTRLSPAIASLPKTNLGLSFKRDFLRDVEALREQAEALAGFLGRTGTTPGAQVIRPSETITQVQQEIRDANKALLKTQQDALALTKQEKANLDKQLVLLQRLVTILGGGATPTTRRANRGAGAAASDSAEASATIGGG